MKKISMLTCFTCMITFFPLQVFSASIDCFSLPDYLRPYCPEDKQDAATDGLDALDFLTSNEYYEGVYGPTLSGQNGILFSVGSLFRILNKVALGEFSHAISIDNNLLIAKFNTFVADFMVNSESRINFLIKLLGKKGREADLIQDNNLVNLIEQISKLPPENDGSYAIFLDQIIESSYIKTTVRDQVLVVFKNYFKGIAERLAKDDHLSKAVLFNSNILINDAAYKVSHNKIVGQETKLIVLHMDVTDSAAFSKLANYLKRDFANSSPKIFFDLSNVVDWFQSPIMYMFMRVNSPFQGLSGSILNLINILKADTEKSLILYTFLMRYSPEFSERPFSLLFPPRSVTGVSWVGDFEYFSAKLNDYANTLVNFVDAELPSVRGHFPIALPVSVSTAKEKEDKEVCDRNVIPLNFFGRMLRIFRNYK